MKPIHFPATNVGNHILPSHRRILIVDDNPAIHADFGKILSPPDPLDADFAADAAALFGSESPSAVDEGFEIDSAYQGQEALKMVEAAVAVGRPYSLAFVDIRMPPGWDGVETIEHLWKCAPDLQIVICTAYSDHSWDDIVLRLGRKDSLLILKKPFDYVEVLQLAHALTERWRLNAQTQRRIADLENRLMATETNNPRRLSA